MDAPILSLETVVLLPWGGTLEGTRPTASQAERQKDLLRKISAYAAAGKEPEEESEEDTARPGSDNNRASAAVDAPR